MSNPERKRPDLPTRTAAENEAKDGGATTETAETPKTLRERAGRRLGALAGRAEKMTTISPTADAGSLRKWIADWWRDMTWEPGDPFWTNGPVDPNDPVACVEPKGARRYMRRYNLVDDGYDGNNVTID